MTERPYWIAAGIMAWGLVLLTKATGLPQFDQHAGIGPGLMPSGIGAGLILLGLMLAWQIRRGVSFEEQGAEDVNDSHERSFTGLGYAAAACALPMLTLPKLGFVITCTGCFVLIARAFKSERWVMNLIIGAAFSLFCWLVFRKLGVQLGGILPLLEV